MKSTAQLKYKILCLSIVLFFSIIVNMAYAQNPGDRFMNKNCEYVHFMNDTLIDFMLNGNYQGSIATLYHGIGRYKISNSQLTIYIDNYNIDSLFERKHPDKSCSNFKQKTKGVDEYRIEIISAETINLVGPIIDDYQKLNKRRFLKSFLNWPWRWSFKKQHWYDPRERELQKIK